MIDFNHIVQLRQSKIYCIDIHSLTLAATND